MQSLRITLYATLSATFLEKQDEGHIDIFSTMKDYIYNKRGISKTNSQHKISYENIYVSNYNWWNF